MVITDYNQPNSVHLRPASRDLFPEFFFEIVCLSSYKNASVTNNIPNYWISIWFCLKNIIWLWYLKYELLAYRKYALLNYLGIIFFLFENVVNVMTFI